MIIFNLDILNPVFFLNETVLSENIVPKGNFLLSNHCAIGDDDELWEIDHFVTSSIVILYTSFFL